MHLVLFLIKLIIISCLTFLDFRLASLFQPWKIEFITEKLLRGIMRFRHNNRAHLITEFLKIIDNPKVCFKYSVQLKVLAFNPYVYSYGLENSFHANNPDKIFVVRNTGNLIPFVQNYGATDSGVSISTEPAALELAIKRGGSKHIFVCGHSDCKAMNTLYNLYQNLETFSLLSPFDSWLRMQGNKSINRLNEALKSIGKKLLTFQSRTHSQFNFEAYIDSLNKLTVEDKLSQV
jgi:carbonic anhydrase